MSAALAPAPNRYAWRRFEGKATLPGEGYFEVWARAFEVGGGAQPFRQPWNPKGYLGNVIHRLPLEAKA